MSTNSVVTQETELSNTPISPIMATLNTPPKESLLPNKEDQSDPSDTEQAVNIFFS